MEYAFDHVFWVPDGKQRGEQGGERGEEEEAREGEETD